MNILKVKFVDFSSDAMRNRTMKILREEFENVEESDTPDFLFYSVFGYEHLKYDCVRIFWTGENLQPDFNICDYAIGFGYMDFEDRYVRIPLYYFYENEYPLAIKKHQMEFSEISHRRKFCNFIYSNEGACEERRVFFEKLSTYKTVDSGGRYMNNIGGPVQDKLEFQRKYRFSIAFENSSTNGYTTEKILQAFAAGTIPIYWGNPNVSRDFNDKAFINCHNYASFDEVIEVVKRVDQDENLFRQYLQEPIGTREQFPLDPLERYREFIVNVCSQPVDKAIRRSNLLNGKKYQEDLLRFKRREALKAALKEKVKAIIRYDD